jgi:hypothetical protein
MQKAALIGLFLVAGCTGSMIYGRVDEGVQVRMFGDAHLEQNDGEFEVKCDGEPGETLMLYFLRKGYFPQIRPVKIPEGKRQQAPGPWKKLPDDQNGVLAGAVCTYGAGGRRAHVFFFEEFLKNQKMPIELDGLPAEVATDESGVFMLLLPPGNHKIKVAWAPRLFGDTAGEVDI